MTKNVWQPRKTARRFLPLSLLALALAATFNCKNEGNGKNKDSASQNDVGFTTQIFCGYDAEHKEFPWQVSIGSTKRSPCATCAFERHFCGGILIADRWVLTAAHCLDTEPHQEKDKVQLIPASELRVVHGATDLCCTDETAHPVEDVFVHPDYIGEPWKNDGNDIALLRLSEPIEALAIDATLQPPDAGDAKKFIFPDARAVVTGYGRNEDGPGSPILQAADIQIVDPKECRGAYSKHTISEGEICAGLPQSGCGSCQGDSGGPLVVKGEGEEYLLAGVVSWGPDDCSEVGKYGVYARVSHYRTWIQKTMQGQ